jgi:hypothetical protein
MITVPNHYEILGVHVLFLGLELAGTERAPELRTSALA